MLELAGGIRFRMDIRDLFELQCAFHRDRMHLTSTEEQRVMLVCKVLRELFDRVVQLQRLLDQRRDLDEALHETALALGIRSVRLAERDDEHAKRNELRRERLRRSDADLGAGAREQYELRLAHERAFRHIANGKRRKVAGLLRHPERRK